MAASLAEPSPIIRWPGGKRWAARRIAERAREHLTNRYIEPFLGGGAVFFALRPREALLGDLNADLIEMYRTVSHSHTRIRVELARLPISARQYATVRAHRPKSAIGRAVRFLYLNHTCFAGIYRENRQGSFNVPYGGGERTTSRLVRTDALKRASEALASATLLNGDFDELLADAKHGDVVYCDPAYVVSNGGTTFARYNAVPFTWEDQQRLASAVEGARRRGATVLVSNGHDRRILDLYSGRRETVVLERQSAVSRNAEYRGRVREYLFVFR